MPWQHRLWFDTQPALFPLAHPVWMHRLHSLLPWGWRSVWPLKEPPQCSSAHRPSAIIWIFQHWKGCTVVTHGHCHTLTDAANYLNWSHLRLPCVSFNRKGGGIPSKNKAPALRSQAKPGRVTHTFSIPFHISQNGFCFSLTCCLRMLFNASWRKKKKKKRTESLPTKKELYESSYHSTAAEAAKQTVLHLASVPFWHCSDCSADSKQ